eukprot:259120_1
MAASLLFLGLNPLFVSPREDATLKKKSMDQKRSLDRQNSKPPSVKPSNASKPKVITKKKLPHFAPIRRYTSSETSESSSEEIEEVDEETVYFILTKQRNEALDQAMKLENELKEHGTQFAVKCDQFKKQLKQYKDTNDYLESENVKLKRDLQRLQDKLVFFDADSDLHHLELLLRKRTKKLWNKPQQQLPNFVRKDYKKKSARFGPKKPNKQNKPPFIHSSSSSSNEESLSSSAAAVDLSFPKRRSLPLSHVRHLTTILEHKSVPIGLYISNSEENIHIDDEWRTDSFADVDARGAQVEEEHLNESMSAHDMMDDNESVSYMSNNTIILNDLSLDLIDDNSQKKPKNVNDEEDMKMKIKGLHIHTNMSTVNELDLDETIVSP